MTPVRVTLPLRLTNPLNGSHQHWSVKARRRKTLRTATAMALRGPVQALATILGSTRKAGSRNAVASHPGPTATVEVTVRVTRIAPSGGLDPHDALPASAKPVVDGVADALGIDDRDARVTWSYGQERGKKGEYAVRIEVGEACPF